MSNQYIKIKKILLLHKHYIFNDKITILYNKLIKNFENGKYNNISGGILTGKLYDDIYSILKDRHIIFSIISRQKIILSLSETISTNAVLFSITDT